MRFLRTLTITILIFAFFGNDQFFRGSLTAWSEGQDHRREGGQGGTEVSGFEMKQSCGNRNDQE